MRLISWVILGLLLSLLPLIVVAAMKDGGGAADFIKELSNEELLAVAFTLSGAAAADVLVSVGSANEVLKLAKWTVGWLTVLITMINVAGYVLFKGHLSKFSPETIVMTEQYLYGGTAIMSFLCELLSEL